MRLLNVYIRVNVATQCCYSAQIHKALDITERMDTGKQNDKCAVLFVFVFILPLMS